MTEPYLSRSELRKLSGRHNRDSVLAWLQAERWIYAPDADGWPKVARAYHDRRLGIVDGPIPKPPTEPNFDALRPTT